MTEPLSLSWIANATNARMIGAETGNVTRIVIDSRQAGPGALFFALRGERSDGHDFVSQALERGAVAAVVSQSMPGISGSLLCVEDPLQALGDLAQHYRSRFSIPVVGITGSVGKTSTKEMTAAVLRARYTTLANERNYNTEIGVPLALFELNKSHEAAVIEMGMRGPGEIDRLAEIARPTVGLITNLGYSHIERLGSREKIAEAKAEIFARLPATGTAILPHHGPFSDLLRSRIPSGCQILTFSTEGNDEADVAVQVASVEPRSGPFPAYLMRVRHQTFWMRLNVAGDHHGANAAAALTVALALEVPPGPACAALERWQGAAGRMTLCKSADGVTILDDCYNAAIESMISALLTLGSVSHHQPAVAILGDMRELGDFAAEAHRRVGVVAAEQSLRLVVTVGDFAAILAEAMSAHRQELGLTPVEIRHFAHSDAAAEGIRTLVHPGDTVLVKGSRALEMEKIVAALSGEPTGIVHG